MRKIYIICSSSQTRGNSHRYSQDLKAVIYDRDKYLYFISYGRKTKKKKTHTQNFEGSYLDDIISDSGIEP